MNPLLLASAAAEPPLIDIDGTVFVQLALFLFLLAVLSRLLFRPYLELRDAREAGMGGAREAARRMQVDAEARLRDYETRLAGAKARGSEERARIRAEGAAREAEIAQSARRESQARLAAGQAEADQDRARLRAEVEPRVSDIGRLIASRLLGRAV